MSLRIAPSPTGFFHLGTARTAYHNWLVARATGKNFIVRIDDTDVARNSEDHVRMIFDCLDWLGLGYDITFRQSDRLHRYAEVARKLVDDGQAYLADNGAVLFKPNTLPDGFTDTVSGFLGIKDDDRKSIDGLVLLKGDGMPTYNFCSIVDDIDYGVTHIIRGVDHIKNTVKQVAIKSSLKYCSDIKFTHVGLIHDMQNKKISKRDGAKSVLDYRDDGVRPGALLNILLRMGWSPNIPNFDSVHKVVTKDAAVGLIMTAGNFKASSSKFDPGKLSWYNKQYGGLSIA